MPRTLLLVLVFVAGVFVRMGLPDVAMAQTSQRPEQVTAEDEARLRFVKRVLADTEDVWHEIFRAAGRTYIEPKVVLFRGMTPTACGTGDAKMGPFYCPLDQKVYLDLSFFDELERRYNAPGEFARAYVIANNVGKHVQTLLGVMARVREAQQRDPRRANEMQLRAELQADCLAGVWANRSIKIKQPQQPSEIESVMREPPPVYYDAALEKWALGRRMRNSLTKEEPQGDVIDQTALVNSTSAQRVRWFTAGFQSGQMRVCDTFGAQSL